jgi:hypothetical protein
MTSAEIVRPRGPAEGYDEPLSHTFMVGHRLRWRDVNREKPCVVDDGVAAHWLVSSPEQMSQRNRSLSTS